jgi:hypothetical protein
VKWQPAWLPTPSVAVQYTVVVPKAKVEFDVGLHATVVLLELPVAVTVKFTTAEHWPGSVDTTIGDGQWMTSGVLFGIVMRKSAPWPKSLPTVVVP